jgi:thiol:disulfide interchange protein
MARTNQRYIPLIFILIVGGLVAARVTSHWVKSRKAPAGEKGALVKWVPLEDAVELASTLNKPILFDFTAEWCQPCHMLDAQVFRDAQLAAKINDDFIPVRVTDRMQEEGRNKPEVAKLQQRYGVRGFPTVVIVDSAGSERGRMEGFGGRDAFERMMEQAR